MTAPTDLWLIRYTLGEQTIYRGFEAKHEAEAFADWALRNAESFSVELYRKAETQ